VSGLALVLGGGGSAAVAWEIGVLHGLVESGADARTADTVVGTSAGSIVAVRLLSGGDTALLYEEVCRPVEAGPMELDYPALEARWAEATAGATSAADARRRIGDLARAAPTMPPEQRRQEIAALLPSLDWPEQRLLVAAVNAGDGQPASFDRDSGVLLDAVAASCAVPGVWPPVEVHGETYIDGAVRSSVNVDLAAGHDRVLVLAPLPPPGGLARELARLPEGTRHHVVEADEQSVASFGANPLDPRSGPAAAREGYRQGRREAAAVAALIAAPGARAV
jgi:NTE family protein